MPIKPIFIAVLSILFHGCAYLSLGYTPLKSLEKYPELNREQKFDVTYSVSYFTNRSDIFGVASEDEIKKEIARKLKATNLFSSVTNAEENKKSPYHFSFFIVYGMASVETSFGVGLLSAYTLYLIPTWLTFSCDMVGLVYLNNKLTHSVATAEIHRAFLWIPLAPVGTVWNFWFAWDYVENKLENYIINDISKYHYSAFTQKTNMENVPPSTQGNPSVQCPAFLTEQK